MLNYDYNTQRKRMALPEYGVVTPQPSKTINTACVKTCLISFFIVFHEPLTER